MRKLFLPALITPALLAGTWVAMSHISMAWTQDPSGSAPAQKSSGSTGPVPSGTMLSVELSKSLDSKKARANDKIEAKTATDLLIRGRIVLPRNTKVVGHVTEAKAHSKTSPGSKLGLTFDRLLLKDGRELPLPMAVQAVARPLKIFEFGNGASNLPDISGTGGRPPSMGAPTLAGASPSSPTLNPRYPDDIGARPSMPPPGAENSTSAPLASTSHGVIGIKDLSLNSSGTVAVFTSSTANVHLDSGAQVILRVQ